MLMREDVLLGKITEIKKDLIELEQQLLLQRDVIVGQNTREVMLSMKNKRLEEENEALKLRVATLTRLRLNERMADQLIGINDRQLIWK